MQIRLHKVEMPAHQKTQSAMWEIDPQWQYIK